MLKRWVKEFIGIEENTCGDENQVFYRSAESLNSTPATNVLLYVTNWNLNKN